MSCIDFCKANANILAASTIKTHIIEIWDTRKGQINKLIKLPEPALQILWRPYSDDMLLVVTAMKNVFLVKPSTERLTNLDYENITAACWHPRNDGLLLLGF